MAWAPDYTTTTVLADYMRAVDTDDAAQMALAITASSRAIDLAAGRQFGKVATSEARYYRVRWDLTDLAWTVDVDDVYAAAGLAVAMDPSRDQSWDTAVTDFVLRPRNSAVKGKPFTYLSIGRTVRLCRGDEVQVTTDKFGWSAFPNVVVQACLLQSSRLMMRRDSPFGVAGSPANGGSELRLLAKLDPDVDVMVRSVTRTWGAV
jgi:hypothetical protein